MGTFLTRLDKMKSAPRRRLFRGVYWGQLSKPDWQAMVVNGKVGLARRRHSGRYAPGLGHVS
jgi:hypothetical protein